jgi:hypothetical protein
MTLMRLVSLCCFASTLGFAGSWSGALVDSKCYATMRGNVNPHETGFAASDQGYPIRYCSPNAKTKAFAVVQQDGMTIDLAPSRSGRNLDQRLTSAISGMAPGRWATRHLPWEPRLAELRWWTRNRPRNCEVVLCCKHQRNGNHRGPEHDHANTDA